jgi:hypothetical protein
VIFVYVAQQGQSQVNDLDSSLRRGQQEIARFDVTMHQTTFVSMLESDRRLANVVTSHGNGQRAVLAHKPSQVRPLDVLHRQEMAAIGFVRIVHRDQVGVSQLGRHSCLALEALDTGLVGQQFRPDHLEGHDAIKPLMAGFVNDTHATTT